MMAYRHRRFWLAEIAIVLCVLAFLSVIVFQLSAEKAQTHCIDHQRHLTRGLLSTTLDQYNVFPLPPEWVSSSTETSSLVIFDCPASKQRGRPSAPEYGMNAFLFAIDPKTGKKVGLSREVIGDPSKIELLADIDGPTAVHSQPSTNPFPGSYTVNSFFGKESNAAWRHGWRNRIAVSYCDGHISVIQRSELTGARRTRFNIRIGDENEK